jgi:hypothetical protein
VVACRTGDLLLALVVVIALHAQGAPLSSISTESVVKKGTNMTVASASLQSVMMLTAVGARRSREARSKYLVGLVRGLTVNR